MGKRNSDKGRLAPFVPIFRHTMKTPAWQALSVGGRATFLELKANYNTKAQSCQHAMVPRRSAPARIRSANGCMSLSTTVLSSR
jgi:hypothetical protein